jgi:hypothetical protein
MRDGLLVRFSWFCVGFLAVGIIAFLTLKGANAVAVKPLAKACDCCKCGEK